MKGHNQLSIVTKPNSHFRTVHCHGAVILYERECVVLMSMYGATILGITRSLNLHGKKSRFQDLDIHIIHTLP